MSIIDVIDAAANEMQAPHKSNPRLADRLEKALQIIEREAPDVLREEVD